MKKIILTFLVLVSYIGLADNWTDTDTGITWSYNVNNEQVNITYGTKPLSGAITIPSQINGMPVSSIGAGAFYDEYGITSLTIPSSVKDIGYAAFSGCLYLSDVTIQEGVTNIALQAFEYCKALTSINIPKSVEYLGGGVFYRCISLANNEGFVIVGDRLYDYVGEATSITIPSGVACIDQYAFANGNITTVSIPDGVTKICEGAFINCRNLVSITIPSTVTSIANRAFANCISLTSIPIPDTVIEIGEGIFDGCKGLVNEDGYLIFRNCLYIYDGNSEVVKIPDGVTKIGMSVFNGCQNIVKVELPESLTAIESYAFCSCERLSSINIPESVTNIGESAFQKCSSLSSIKLPSRITIIADSLFSGSGLTSVNIPDGVTKIERSAFMDCMLTEIELPESVTEIERSAFSGCKFTQVVLPESVAEIGVLAFSDCDDLASVTILSDEIKIGDMAFLFCYSLKTFYVGSNCNIDTLKQKLVDSGFDIREVEFIRIDTAPQTTTTPVPVPYVWLDSYIGEFGDTYEEAGNAMGLNGVPLWKSYVAGLDPTSADSQFLSTISFGADGTPIISFTPALNGLNEDGSGILLGKRTYRIYGKKSHKDNWEADVSPADGQYHFFKVTVELP